MESIIQFFMFVARLGALGLFLVGIMDSSFLFMPLGNDLLILTLTARQPVKLAFYSAAAAVGSVTGAMLVDFLARKGGEKGLSRFVPAGQIDKVKARVSRRGGYALALAALLPPPFPFTPIVAAASALQFPRRRMIAILLSARMLRFSVIGLLGMTFGDRILKLGELPAVQWTLLGFLVICIVGSVYSVYGWIRRARNTSPDRQRTELASAPGE